MIFIYRSAVKMIEKITTGKNLIIVEIGRNTVQRTINIGGTIVNTKILKMIKTYQIDTKSTRKLPKIVSTKKENVDIVHRAHQMLETNIKRRLKFPQSLLKMS